MAESYLIEYEKHAPCRAVIENKHEIFMKDAQNGFVAFYADYYNILDFLKDFRLVDIQKLVQTSPIVISPRRRQIRL